MCDRKSPSASLRARRARGGLGLALPLVIRGARRSKNSAAGRIARARWAQDDVISAVHAQERMADESQARSTRMSQTVVNGVKSGLDWFPTFAAAPGCDGDIAADLQKGKGLNGKESLKAKLR